MSHNLEAFKQGLKMLTKSTEAQSHTHTYIHTRTRSLEETADIFPPLRASLHNTRPRLILHTANHIYLYIALSFMKI